jgi:biopolymer transport protein ExbD
VRRRRPRRRLVQSTDLTLAAMVDMMVNILMFLLHLYGSDPNVSQQGDIELARSSAHTPVEGRVVVVVSKDGAAIGGDLVGSFALEGELGDLREALVQEGARERDEEARRSVLVEVDRAVPWPDLRRVLRAVSAAGYEDVRFVVATESEPTDEG